MSGEYQNKNTLINVLDFTVDKLLEAKKSVGVLGEKIESDGMTIIPVSKLSIGFAGGGADITEKQKGKYKNPAGTGVSISDIPLMCLVIKDGEVSAVKISGEQKKSLAGDIITTTFEEVKKIIEEKKKSKEKSK